MRFKLLALLLILAFTTPAFAVDFIVGAKAGNFVWVPFYREIDASFFKFIEKNGSGILYGPVVSLSHEDLSLSFVWLQGTQTASWHIDDEYFADENYYESASYSMKAKRTDIDSALSYRITQNFKLFAGYKYQKIDNNMKSTERRGAGADDNGILVFSNSVDFYITSHGPALGLGYSVTLSEIIFLTANFSCLYMKGKFEMDTFIKKFDGTPPVEQEITDNAVKADIIQYGINFEPSVGARINNHVIITLGGRFQWLRSEADTDIEAAQGKFDDYLYGIFVSTLFVF